MYFPGPRSTIATLALNYTRGFALVEGGARGAEPGGRKSQLTSTSRFPGRSRGTGRSTKPSRGWTLLEATRSTRRGKNPFAERQPSGRPDRIKCSCAPSPRGPRSRTHECGRQDVASVRRRGDGELEYLARGFASRSLDQVRKQHLQDSGNVSANSTGNAVDIAQVNGIRSWAKQGGLDHRGSDSRC